MSEQGVRPRVGLVARERTFEHERVDEPAREAPSRVRLSRGVSGGSRVGIAAESFQRLGAMVVHERDGVPGTRHGSTLGGFDGGIQHP